MRLHEIAEAIGGRVIPAGAADVEVARGVIDSRRVEAGDLFVALPGTHAHGHDLVDAARARGAAAAMVERECESSIAQVVAKDSRVGLLRWAQAARARFADTVIAITGSNGKTTVKEMVAAICRAAYGDAAVHCNSGNYNNELGVALTLTGLRDGHRVLVSEVGMDSAGEITRLKAILRPHIMLINNAQRAHLGNFNSVEDIARAKGELVAGAGGIALLNCDDPHYAQWRDTAARHEIVSFGHGAGAQVRGVASAAGVAVCGIDIALRVLGAHNVANATAATATARALGIPIDAVVSGLSRFGGAPGRLQLREVAGGGAIIDDTYNANPDSTLAAAAALRTLARKRNQRAVLALGDMLELGDSATALHRSVLAQCRDWGVEVFGVGDITRAALDDMGLARAAYANKELLAEAVAARMRKSPCCVLVKGSRAMKMETVAAALTGARAA